MNNYILNIYKKRKENKMTFKEFKEKREIYNKQYLSDNVWASINESYDFVEFQYKMYLKGKVPVWAK